ncbi:MAG: metal ABC transporter substrate-binding protein [Actinobacteria bacterium]|nr:metal ABC transporter substrate-binding protein [Actinomycetota bacterium]
MLHILARLNAIANHSHQSYSALVHRRFAAVAALLLWLVVAACSGDDGEPPPPQVVAAFYPLQYVAENVAGDDAEVTSITPPGAEPHDLELTSSQIVEITGADLLVYVGDSFQPAVEDLLPEVEGETLDALSVNPTISRPSDPHIWLDPVAMVSLTRQVGMRLAEIDPDHADDYDRRVSDLVETLNAVDDRFQGGLTLCDRRQIVTSHEAFGYMADRYHLEQISVGGVDPEQEQPPQRLAEVAGLVEELGVTTIFFERLIPPDVAETIAAETGAQTAQLDPLESPPESGDYPSAMMENLQALRSALGCR